MQNTTSASVRQSDIILIIGVIRESYWVYLELIHMESCFFAWFMPCFDVFREHETEIPLFFGARCSPVTFVFPRIVSTVDEIKNGLRV